MFGIDNMHNNISHIIKTDEKYQINKNIITANEMLEFSFNRYLSMKKILNPLLRILNKKVVVNNIYYRLDNDDELSIIIDYSFNSKKGFLGFKETHLLNSIEKIIDSSNGQFDYLMKEYQDLLKNIFLEGEENAFYDKIRIISTSKLFELVLIDNGYQILYNGSHNINDVFKLTNEYNIAMDSFSDITNSFVCNTSFEDIENLLCNKDNLFGFLKHIKVYENDIPKILIKK